MVPEDEKEMVRGIDHIGIKMFATAFNNNFYSLFMWESRFVYPLGNQRIINISNRHETS